MQTHAPHAPHHTDAEIDRHVRTYLTVFGALLVLTLATVGAWKFLHLPLPLTITLALFIAVVKGSLVACYFMHLVSERKLIHYVLAMTVVFFFVLLLLPMVTSMADAVQVAG
ncbi:MAG: cytochrome C oxidase subunit IV family protein [Candidatus Polarisedimenticolia bacterium]